MHRGPRCHGGRGSQITCTAHVGTRTPSFTSILRMVSYVLIALVAIALLVSGISISLIGQISVLERTKEIEILRAIGASKRNISQVFHVETFLIDTGLGPIGAIITELLTLTMGAIIHLLTGSSCVNAVLRWQYAILLVVISMVITCSAAISPHGGQRRKARSLPCARSDEGRKDGEILYINGTSGRMAGCLRTFPIARQEP